MRSIYQWVEELEQSLPENASPMLRNALVPVRHRLQDFDETIFTYPKSKYALQRAAKEVATLAETEFELEATAHILSCLYAYYKPLKPELVEHKVTWPLRDEPQYIDDHTPHLVTTHELYSLLYKEIPPNLVHLLDHDAALGKAILTVVFRSGISSYQKLIDIIFQPMSSWLVIPSPCPVASLYLPKRKSRVYVIEEAILAMHKILLNFGSMTPARRTNTLRKCLKAWKKYATQACQPHLSEQIEATSIADIVKYIAFFHQAPINKTWLNQQVALEDYSFIRAFSSHTVEHKSQERSVKTLLNEDSASWGRSTHLGLDQHEKLRSVLTKLQETNPKGKRNTKAYKRACDVLEGLATHKISWRSSLLINWITSLLLHGSPWKKTLRPGTLLDYHSTVKNFIEKAWCIGDEIEGSIRDFEQSCQYGINQISDADRQRTIIRFLQYCLEYEQFPSIDTDSFELLSRKKTTRAHYVTPERFDQICQTYEKTQNPTTFPIVLIMQLCYYGGCREDEALSLYLMDIDFDTGLLYITDRQGRKSSSAVRKIPLSLFPNHLLKALNLHIRKTNRERMGDPINERKMFDHDKYSVAEKHFINFLRKELKDDSLVTHSLRHCAANNWVYMLSKLAFQTNTLCDPLFCYHELFSSEQLEKLDNSMRSCGWEITPHFPILHWVSCIIGHSSPSVTITNYLHILDWISLNVTKRSFQLPARNVRFWTSESTYGFEITKQLLDDDNLIKPSELQKWVKRHWKQGQHYSVALPSEKTIEDKEPLSLLAFNKYFQSTENTVPSASLDRWLSDTRATPVPFMPLPNQHSAWLKLCSTADIWRNIKPAALLTWKKRLFHFLRIVQKDEITNLRDLRYLLSVFYRFDLPPISIKVNARENSKSLSKWKNTMKRYGAAPIVIHSNVQTKATTRPYKLRWALWGQIKDITILIINYFDYLEFAHLQENKGE
ncbi:tyrosine-type recombinase/integrase [Vibrio parahaemolyticus]|nr:tyrosine-type recombinase/integrase [Vibrio parahaemolyticus]